MAQVTIQQLTNEDIEKKGIPTWSVWEKEVSRFDWSYDSTEECFIIEGEVTVETDEGNYNIKAGDFVTFNKGLTCVWDIKKDIRKYYNFR